jgi:hypothetical protein
MSSGIEPQRLTRRQHLLICLIEECAEVSHRVSKALRFGLFESQPGQDHNNAQRIEYEMRDLLTAVQVIQEDGALAFDLKPSEEKRAKIEKYLTYARSLGMLWDHADADRRIDQLESKILRARSRRASLCPDNEFHGRVFERHDECNSCGMTREEYERELNPGGGEPC